MVKLALKDFVKDVFLMFRKDVSRFHVLGKYVKYGKKVTDVALVWENAKLMNLVWKKEKI